jgi:hypothetical protein
MHSRVARRPPAFIHPGWGLAWGRGGRSRGLPVMVGGYLRGGSRRSFNNAILHLGGWGESLSNDPVSMGLTLAAPWPAVPWRAATISPLLTGSMINWIIRKKHRSGGVLGGVFSECSRGVLWVFQMCFGPYHLVWVLVSNRAPTGRPQPGNRVTTPNRGRPEIGPTG